MRSLTACPMCSVSPRELMPDYISFMCTSTPCEQLHTRTRKHQHIMSRQSLIWANRQGDFSSGESGDVIFIDALSLFSTTNLTSAGTLPTRADAEADSNTFVSDTSLPGVSPSICSTGTGGAIAREFEVGSSVWGSDTARDVGNRDVKGYNACWLTECGGRSHTCEHRNAAALVAKRWKHPILASLLRGGGVEGCNVRVMLWEAVGGGVRSELQIGP